MKPIRTGVFFILILSLLPPYPAIITAQETPPAETDESVTLDNASTNVPANEHANENAIERELPESSQAQENQGQDKEPSDEDEMVTSQSESLTISAGDPDAEDVD
jgi:hypothetical protein